jgi:hypothetical protein
MPPNLAPLSGAYKKVAVVRELEADDQTEFELLRLRGLGGYQAGIAFEVSGLRFRV